MNKMARINKGREVEILRSKKMDSDLQNSDSNIIKFMVIKTVNNHFLTKLKMIL